MDIEPNAGQPPGHNPRQRMLMLPLIAALLLGGYFAADSVAALGPLLVSELGLGRADIGLLYGVYSWPNVVMVLFGGLLTDRIGPRRASLLYSALIVLGTALVALSPSLRGVGGLGGRAVFYGMVAGRTLLGLGAESLAVCQNAMITRWFRGHQLALAFALTLTLARVGSLLSFATEADIAAHFGGVGAGLWAAFLVCLLSALCNVIYVLLDRRLPELPAPSVPPPDASSGGLLSRAADFLRFGPKYYLLVAFCVCFYSAFFPFTALAADFLGEKWQLDAAVAGRLCSLLTAMTVLLSPVFGGYLDRGDRQKRSDRVLLSAALLLVPAYLLLGLSSLPPLPAFLLLGLAFSLAPAALWPQIGHLVAEHRVATAYGLMTMLQSVALAVVPWFSGTLRDRTASYTASMLLFTIMGGLSVLWALLLMRRVSPRV